MTLSLPDASQMAVQKYQSFPGDATRVYRALCLVLTDSESQVPWATFTAEDWRLFAHMAQAEGVAPLVYWTFRTHGRPVCVQRTGRPDHCPITVHRSLATAYYQSLAHNILLTQELGCILRALDQAGIPVILLKGTALAATLYPHLALRPMSDLDLLVPRQHLEAATGVVQSLGYQETHPEPTPGWNGWLNHHQHLRQKNPPGLAVELHWNLVAGDADWRSPSLDWFWEQAAPFSVNSDPYPACQRVFVLMPTAHLLYLSAHLALQHGMARAQLLWFYDIHRLVSHWGDRLDWEELRERAEALRWASALTAALLGTRERFCTLLPEGFLDTLRASGDPRSWRLVQRKANASQTRALHTWNRLATLNWPGRLHLLRGLFFPGRAFVRQRYHTRPAWLWPLGYLYRWLDMLREGISTFLACTYRFAYRVTAGEAANANKQISWLVVGIECFD
jgi:hypothetical protein